jgi:PAS domain S-box-containing protein
MVTSFQQVWEISYTVTRILSESNSPAEPLQAILDLLTQRLSWDIGQLWRADYDDIVLRYAACSSFHSENFTQFIAISKARTFAIGEGLPGTVWKLREPFWVLDVTAHDNFPRASIAKKEGVHTGVGFPVLIANRVLVVYEFFSREILQPDEQLISLFRSLGWQIGQFLDRIRAEEAVTSAHSHFRTLAAASVDGIITIDENSRIMFVNSAAEKIFGYTRAELQGAPLTILMPEYLRRVHENGIRRYGETGQRHLSWDGVELPGLHKDGSTIPLKIAFGEVTQFGKRLFSGYVRDLRAQKSKAASSS